MCVCVSAWSRSSARDFVVARPLDPHTHAHTSGPLLWRLLLAQQRRRRWQVQLVPGPAVHRPRLQEARGHVPRWARPGRRAVQAHNVCGNSTSIVVVHSMASCCACWQAAQLQVEKQNASRLPFPPDAHPRSPMQTWAPSQLASMRESPAASSPWASRSPSRSATRATA